MQVVEVLAELRQRAPQWEIDGPDNIWILKPGGKSRGRGIHCFNNLAKLRHQVLPPLPRVACMWSDAGLSVAVLLWQVSRTVVVDVGRCPARSNHDAPARAIFASAKHARWA